MLRSDTGWNRDMEDTEVAMEEGMEEVLAEVLMEDTEVDGERCQTVDHFLRCNNICHQHMLKGDSQDTVVYIFSDRCNKCYYVSNDMYIFIVFGYEMLNMC